MSLFSKRETSPIPSTNFSVFDSHISISGDVETDGALRVDGRLEGSILRADLIVIGEGASIVGDVTAREVIVGGAVTGNIFASQRTELQSTGIVAGDIRSAAILIHEGGVSLAAQSVAKLALDHGKRRLHVGAAVVVGEEFIPPREEEPEGLGPRPTTPARV